MYVSLMLSPKDKQNHFVSSLFFRAFLLGTFFIAPKRFLIFFKVSSRLQECLRVTSRVFERCACSDNIIFMLFWK